MCGDAPEVDLGWKVMCVRVPEGTHLRVFNGVNYEGEELDISESIPCLAD